jgi:Pectinacetylesterase
MTGHRSKKLALLLVLAALAATLAACGDNDDGAGAAATTTATTNAAAGDRAWERVVPGGDCQCADGSKFNFWVRKANPNKVLFYLRAGGACFTAKTCVQNGSNGSDELYSSSLGAAGDPPGQWDGIFDFANKRNPFADYSVVYVPYCTGDAHLGDATTKYTPDLTVHHKGYVNGTAALNYTVASFPKATDVVVAGVSAGAAATPLYAGLASDQLPHAHITVLADGTGATPPDLPGLSGRLAAAWGTSNTIPAWPENAGLTADKWTTNTGLFTQSGRHDPKIVFARHDYAYDHTQTLWYPALGAPTPDLLSIINRHETQIESAGVNMLSYIAPGDDHGALQYDSFYTEEVNGVKLVDWVTSLIAGKPVDDVHCQKCRGG